MFLAGDVSPNPGWALPALNQHGLKIAHLNVRSLSQHWDEFQILIQDNPFDVMCLTETWLKPCMTDSELHLDGYNLIRNDRTGIGGGGNAIYYNSKLMARPRTDINCGLDVEAIPLEITFPTRSRVLVCSAYCADKTLCKDFKPCLETMLDRAPSENIELFFLGDFNQDLLPKRLTADVRDVRQTFSTYQLTQLIKSPTRITNRSKALIDHIYTSDSNKVIASGVSQCAISDHSLIYLVRRCKKLSGPSKVINYRNFKNYISKNFKADLHTASWDEIDTSLTVGEAWDAFSTTLGNVIDQHVPLDTKRVRTSTLPWLTSEIRALMRSRDFHHKRAQKTQADREWRAYRDLRNKTTSLIRKSKREYYSHVINANKRDSGKLWKALKSAVSTSTKNPSIGSLETESSVTSEPREIAQGFAKYFHTAIMKIRQTVQRAACFLPMQKSQDQRTFRLSVIKEGYFCKELKKIKTS